jgi:hypothetical protein
VTTKCRACLSAVTPRRVKAETGYTLVCPMCGREVVACLHPERLYHDGRCLACEVSNLRLVIQQQQAEIDRLKLAAGASGEDL